MKNIKISFKHENGKIYLVMSQLVWGETITHEREITEDVMPVVDDCLDYRLGLDDYKRVNGVITYIGKSYN